nr:CHAT domain-containing protein [uncultured Flavobacterium sp.]
MGKASRFVELADADLKNLKIIKDTTYADYLYRKDILNYFQSKKSSELLYESLAIWGASKKKNYSKIMKIHYFLGKNYFFDKKEELAISSFEKCYEINEKYKIKENRIFPEAVYLLAGLYFDKGNNNKAEKFSNEYIALVKSTAYKDYNFSFANAYLYKKDIIGQEKVLLGFLNNYSQMKLDNPILLCRINYQLFRYYNENNRLKETIKYGEDTYEIYTKAKINSKEELKLIILILIAKYGEIGDSINRDKYEKLQYSYFPEDEENDYYAELERLMKAEDFEKFKIKFDKYEGILKSQENFDDLFGIYALSITLFERNVIFKKDEVIEQIEFIKKNSSSLSKENQIIFDILIVEYLFMTNEFSEALKICKSRLDVQDINQKLFFYKYKAIIEMTLANGDSKKTAYKTLEIANSIYDDNSPQMLPYMSTILLIDSMGEDINTTKIASKTLQILYDNNLDDTDIAAGIWLSLGNTAFLKKNLKDARIYYEKTLKILESAKVISNPVYYCSGLFQLATVNVLENNFEKSLEYSNKAKVFLDNNPQIPQLVYGDYYDHLGHYYFYQDQYKEAMVNYEKSFAIYGENISKARKINYILCDYFINNDVDKTVITLEKYHKENKGSDRALKIIYLLKFNSGEFVASRNLLVKQLKNLISDNNQYFHLLSDYEKEILQKNFSDQFEFLNTHLLSNDADFLKEYINFRFYSKSLLFSNSFKVDDLDDKNKDLYSELKNNIVLINKANESKVADMRETEGLKIRNREIEKFLSAKNTSLSVPTLNDLTSKLKVNDAYVEIIRINKQSRSTTKKGIDIVNQFTDSISYCAIIIKKNSTPKFILIDGNNQLEKRFVSNFKTKIQNKQEDIESYHLLFDKIDNELKDVKKIYLVTDGVYNSINIESIYNPNRKQYLIDYLKIQPIQNVRAITDDKKDFKVGMNTKTILFGNPDFDLFITDAKIDNFSLDRGLDNTVIDEIKSSVKIGRLNGTQKEIETLDAILKNSKSTVELFSKANATEDNLKKIQSPDILHIATHGYFLSNDDTSKTKQSIANIVNDNYKNDFYLKSGLLLAGAQNTLNGKQPENSNNGILTAEEAKNLNLKDTELVVLSACETGLGDNLVGEGVIGLQRAFMIAGAKSVIMSLWSVSDEKTQELMTLFYTCWIKKNMSKEESLYQAKLEMKKLYPQPYYWAGFVLLE